MSRHPHRLFLAPLALLAAGLWPLLQPLLAQRQASPFIAANKPATAISRAKPYLNLPPTADGQLPRHLSETGAFADVRTLAVAPGLIAYTVNVPLWSDGAIKRRWIALPPDVGIHFDANRPWTFPAGTVFVKHFEIVPDASDPNRVRRLETRLLVRAADGGVYGATYRWRADGSDADLCEDGSTEPLTIDDEDVRGPQTFVWQYPSRSDCLKCHTPDAGGVLGVNARQLNRPSTDAFVVNDNQLAAWSRAGLFDRPLGEAEIAAAPALVPLSDASASLELRARSYLDANCAQCHHPAGAASGEFDARISTPLDRQRLVDGPVRINLGLDHARVIAPHDPSRSVLLARMQTTDQPKMPPLGHNRPDLQAIDVLREWIRSLPGPEVNAPPTFSPVGGDFSGPVRVTLARSDPAAEIRYTLDGSPPSENSQRYEGPIVINQSSTLRARTFRSGATRSVIAQETYIVNRP